MYLFFDTETTGLPKSWSAPASDSDNWPRLVQLAWLLFDKNGQEKKRFETIIRPEGFKIPRNASRVHGISTAKAIKEGTNLNKALKQFSSVMEKAELLIAHNIRFDEKIIDAEFLRKNIPNNISQIQKFCTMRSTTDYCRLPSNYGYKWPSLAELHLKLFDSTFKNAHNALADIEATAKCFFEIKKRGIVSPL